LAPNVPDPRAWSLSFLPAAAIAPPTAVRVVAITLGLQSCFAKIPPMSAVPTAPSAVYARRWAWSLSSGARGVRGPALRYFGLDVWFFFWAMGSPFRRGGGSR